MYQLWMQFHTIYMYMYMLKGGKHFKGGQMPSAPLQETQTCIQFHLLPGPDNLIMMKVMNNMRYSPAGGH